MTDGAQNNAKGRRAENIAALSLRFLGWQILARRFTSGRGSGAGEVDLVARKGSTLAFVEVKARPTREDALAALSEAQKARIARGAEAWMAKHPAKGQTFVRFDLIAVPDSGRPLHLADAWRPDF
jgi:putative endonuclease